MSKSFHHFVHKHSVAIQISLWLFWLVALTAYAVTIADIQTHIDRIAWVYKDVDGMNQRYDRIARDQELTDVGLSEYFLGISLLHRTVASYHNRIADYADQRVRDAWGVVPDNPWDDNPGDTNTWGTSTWGTNTWGVREPIGNQHLQVQFYGVPYSANSRGTLTRGRDYDGYYGLSNKISEEGPFLCKAWYSTNKAKTMGREITFNVDNGVTNTSPNRTDKLVMKIDQANDVTETALKVTCSGVMGWSWKTLEYNETFNIVSPARAVISSFRVSDNNPAPNESLTFTWQTTGAVGCALIQLADGGVRFSLPGQVANGTFTRNADSSGRSTYRLICTNSIGEDSTASDIDVAVQSSGTGTTTPASCGSAKDQSFTSAPNTNLCTVWNPNPSPAGVDPANANKWKWICSLGSSQITCSANKTSTNQTGATNTAQCGSANNGSFSTAPTYNLCIQSSPNPNTPALSTTTNKWNWNCSNWAGSVSCSANYTTVTTAQCGTSNNGNFATAPTTNLCIQSTPNPAVPGLNTTTNKWGWNCSNGSQNITCSANKITNTTQTGSTGPKCGAVNNWVYITAPTTYLCDTGSPQPTVPTLDTATNKWKWSCTGSGQTANCSATKWDINSLIWQYAFSPQCADEENFITLGWMAATLGNQNVSTNYSPTTICKMPSNIPSNIFNFLTELVDPIDTTGTDGYFDWKCKWITSNGSIDNGGAVTCRAKRVIDAQCGPYTNVPRTTFDELTPGIRWSEVPEALKRSYCTVGNPMHEVDERRLDTENFGLFHWRCVSPDFYAKTCSAPYLQSRDINFTASKTTIQPNENVTFNWSLPINTAFVKCYPVYDYRAQSNNVYDFYLGSKRDRQWSFAANIDKTQVVSLYCIGKTNEVYAQKDIVVTVTSTTPQAVNCRAWTTTLKSADQQNTCNFAWAQTAAGQPTNAVTTTGGGVLSGKCGTDGSWEEWAVSCPNRTTAVSCPGGGATFYSEDNSNKCVASLNQSSSGTVLTDRTGLTITSNWPAATGKATCKGNGDWSYQVNCPSTNTTVKTCPGGVEHLKNKDGSLTCTATWAITKADSWSRTSVTNLWTLRAYCNANGDWDPNTVTWTCWDNSN
jgi:hypothetical protein